MQYVSLSSDNQNNNQYKHLQKEVFTRVGLEWEEDKKENGETSDFSGKDISSLGSSTWYLVYDFES